MIGLAYRIAGEMDWPIQPMMMGPSQYNLWRSSGGTSNATTVGAVYSVSGTAAAAAFTTTSLATRQQRTNYLSASSANANAGIYQSSSSYLCRSATAGRGGFFFYGRLM